MACQTFRKGIPAHDVCCAHQNGTTIKDEAKGQHTKGYVFTHGIES
jgi:hypothetical protein